MSAEEIRPRLLLVEDDGQLGPVMAKVLDEVYDVTLVNDGGDALELTSEHTFDAMVIDRRLPTVDGITLIETLRHAGSNVPMLVLTALGTVHDKVRGLDAGANDYLVKPFEFDELFARLRAIRRVRNGEGPFVRIGAWEFYPDFSVGVLPHRRQNNADGPRKRTAEAVRHPPSADLLPQRHSACRVLPR